ncbi:MarR family winged helix-turn-helix transcriptional regulator [Streptomyces sp. NPDC055078]
MTDGMKSDAVDLMLAQWRRERPDIDSSPLAVLGRLHRSYNLYQGHIGRVFEKHGLSMAAFGVLAALRRQGDPYGCTAGRLAELNLVTTGGITQAVDKLVRAGLVRRERDESDRRVITVKLTTGGLDLLNEVATEHFEREGELLAGLSATDRKLLADLLKKLETSLKSFPG